MGTAEKQYQSASYKKNFGIIIIFKYNISKSNVCTLSTMLSREGSGRLLINLIYSAIDIIIIINFFIAYFKTCEIPCTDTALHTEALENIITLLSLL